MTFGYIIYNHTHETFWPNAVFFTWVLYTVAAAAATIIFT